MRAADVVIVGGGAVGASVAWHLTELGITNVVLVERDTLGSGSTSKSAGGIRAQFADELNIRIAVRSLEEFTSFEDRLGTAIDFRQWGYLFLLDGEDDLELFRNAVTLQNSLGVPSRELSVDEALAIVPQLAVDGVLGATYCPWDGYASPEAVVQGYAGAAAARGVQVRQGCAVTGIDVRDGRIAAVETTRGRIETETVVCTAGVWSAEVGALAGVEIPVRGERRTLWFAPEDGGLPTELPLTVDFSTSFYFHREGPGLIFGGRDDELDAVAEDALRRLPVLAELPIQTSWWGFYEVSPDYNALVGEAAAPTRFLYATGFSGHGFQQAPAVGEHLAELVAGRTPTLDLSPFSLERFARGEVREEAFVI